MDIHQKIPPVLFSADPLGVSLQYVAESFVNDKQSNVLMARKSAVSKLEQDVE